MVKRRAHCGSELSIDSLGSADFLKVDTEGYDLKCLLTAHNLISTESPVVLFEHDIKFRDTSYEDYIKVLLEFRHYSCLVFYSNLGFMEGVYRPSDLLGIELMERRLMSLQVDYYDILALPKKYEWVAGEELEHFKTTAPDLTPYVRK